MSTAGYAIVSLDDERWSGDAHVSLTSALGCTDTTVNAYRLPPGASIALPIELETTCVPLDADGTLETDESIPVPANCIARVPAGVAASLRSESETTWLAIGASTDPEPSTSPAVVDPGTVTFAPPSTSDIPTARLTAQLGCTGMKINLRRLAPDMAIPYHTEGTQEELFVPLGGPGTLRVDGETHLMPAHSVARVAPAVPRAAVNEGTEDRLWFMIGAPPTGGADDWDPGAVILDWPDDA